MIILLIETTAETCSVALSEDGLLLWQQIEQEPMRHSEVLAPFVAKALDELSRREKKLDAVAVSMGPGSYTGLRIGLSEAKGLCFGMDIPLIGINTLQAMAVKAMFMPRLWEGTEIFVPMVDARRLEVYTAAYDFALNPVIEPQPLVLDQNDFSSLPDDREIFFFGSGAEKAKEYLAASNMHFLNQDALLASDMIALAEKAFRENRFEDIAYSTPTYLKAVHTTVPKSKGLC